MSPELAPNADEGFDSLRRVTRHRWEKFTAGDTTPGNDTLLVGFGHEQGSVGADGRANPAYDRMNNKLIEEKLHDADSSEVYVYDSVYRVTLPTSTYRSPAPAQAFRRGTLNAGRTDVSTTTTRPAQLQTQDFGLDGLGNWQNTVHKFQGAAQGTESRTHTDFNEVNALTGTPYAGNATGTQALDKNGNLTDDNVRTYKWDALNRLREVFRKFDSLQISVYSYDCMNRRIRTTVSNGGLDGSQANGTTDFYYEGWRVVEEHNGSDAITQQYVYGNYLDEVWVLDDRVGVTIADLNDGTGNQLGEK